MYARVLPKNVRLDTNFFGMARFYVANKLTHAIISDMVTVI
jgi:hypothetical protein